MFSSALRILTGPEGQLLAALEGVPQSGNTIAATLGQLTELAVLRFPRMGRWTFMEQWFSRG